MSETTVQCPCGHTIEDYRKYLLLYLKKEMEEIDILCPNEYCYLRELGFLKFKVTETGVINFDKGRFYAPFVTWNATRISGEMTVKILKQHLIDIVEKSVRWDKVRKNALTKKANPSTEVTN